MSVKEHHRYNKQHADLLAPLREPFAVALSNDLHYQDLIKAKEFLVDANRYFQEELRKLADEEIIGADYGLKGVMELVHQVSPLDSSVLLLGDTGTGKELIASAIHSFSKRCHGPMVKMNCGAISPSLIDTEPFGHEKGAFTGPIAMKRGRFERAHKGTIF
ncbi:MAG: sigma 54-interacting transcriptional regulator [Desulfobacteraceae bacterium]